MRKIKFIKPFSSIGYCLNKNNSTKNMWKLALRDPGYLFILFLSVGMFFFCLYLFLNIMFM